MRIVVFGLTVSSSWGNGHATLWRGLIRALSRLGCRVTFFERDLPFYAQHRDLHGAPWVDLVFHEAWEDVLPQVRRALAEADAAIVTSYCPDARAATREILSSDAIACFYDLDTPVTLARLARGEDIEYLGPNGLADFDLVLSYTGGAALDALRARLGARVAAPLYGHVDPRTHAPVASTERLRSDLSYLGTYAQDRQTALEAFFVEPARRRPERRFLLAGAQYPQDFPWTENIHFLRHLPPADHPAFFCSSRLTLNVTRAAMASLGWCPSGRLFEAAACGAAVVSDVWEGLDAFFAPDAEILLARTTEDVTAALDRSDDELRRIGAAARVRVLDEHTSGHRARTLLDLLGERARPPSRAAMEA